MDDQQLLRYSRHLLLPEFDVAGQQALLNSTVFVLGAGGLGCAATQYLAASGIGHLIIADNDSVERSNLPRQILFGESDIGTLKVEEAKKRVQQNNPELLCTTVTKRLNKSMMRDWVAQADVVVDCGDNFATRFALNEACVEQKKPLVSGAAIRFEGHLAVFDSRQENQPCYRCLYTEHQADESCSETGVLSPVVGVIGTQQALETIKLIVGLPSLLLGKLQFYSALDGGYKLFTIAKDEHCPVCSNK